MKYFANCTTLDALKHEYRRLCMIHHPDRGGDTIAIDSDYVNKHLGELVQDPDLSRYIL